MKVLDDANDPAFFILPRVHSMHRDSLVQRQIPTQRSRSCLVQDKGSACISSKRFCEISTFNNFHLKSTNEVMIHQHVMKIYIRILREALGFNRKTDVSFNTRNRRGSGHS